MFNKNISFDRDEGRKGQVVLTADKYEMCYFNESESGNFIEINPMCSSQLDNSYEIEFSTLSEIIKQAIE